ncbi:hypothetical protein H0H87_001277 [Tephrocybe sp. NHM501043]|nr:hypothetical protein H0H87_001277 [Tephrocybe sp. NHM501043]
MPLPESTISLGPLTNPGETEPTKPKVAMLVRLSSATIDALTSIAENKQDMEFQFGETPGIHIGGTFYSMRMQKEETPHEIYLRTTMKNGAGPLKLYANVTEKLFIEHNEVGDDLKDKLREKTLEAAKQRDNHKTKFIETPPVQPTKAATKKKKETTMFRKPRPTDQAKVNASTSSAARIPSPIPPPRKKKPADPALRNRLIHCIAIQERTRDAIIKLVTGGDASVRRDVVDLLEEVAEPTSPLKKGEDSGNKIMVLRKEAWLDVRPMEWPNLSEKVRLQLQRTGRLELQRLGYKDTDPEWAPFTFKATDSSSSSTTPVPSRAVAVDAQRGKPDGPPKAGLMSSKEAKKPKPQSDPNAEIRMKDESAKAVPRPSGKMKEATSSNPAAPTTTRKLPGSGFIAGKASTPTNSPSIDTPPRDSTPRGKIAEKDTQPRPTLPHKGPPQVPASQKEKASSSTATTQRIKKVRESDAGYGSEIERDKATRPKPVIKQEWGSERRASDVPTLKRRPRNEYDSDASAAPPKKRRTENGAAVSTSSSKDARRDLSLPKKPDVPPPLQRQKMYKEPSPIPPPPPPPPVRQKMRKESSPLPQLPPQPQPTRQKAYKEPSPLPPPIPLPKINKKANVSSRPSTSLNDSKMSPHESTSSTQSPRDSRARGESKVSVKRRRGSPIYTSSSDEEGEARNVRARGESPKAPFPAPPAANGNGRSATQSRSARAHESKPLPTDHASLRVRYNTTYAECLVALTTLMAQKSRIDSLLRNGDRGSVTDSEGDAELMNPEELEKLSRSYARMHEELETIRQRFDEPVQ